MFTPLTTLAPTPMRAFIPQAKPKFGIKQDTTVRAAADTTQQTVTAPAAPPPEIRTPQNGGYLELAYGAASFVYISYLVIMYRRWKALRSRQASNAASSGR